MRTLLLCQWLVRLFLILACLGAAPQAARADALDSFVDLYGKIEGIVGQGVLPVRAAYLRDSLDYIRCIANGTDVAVCTDRYHETGAGKDAATAAGIPTGFWMALDAYVAYINGDYWEAAYSLGEAAVCAAIQVFTGGVDLCGVITELYELAKSLWEGGQAVLDFLADVGGAIFGAAEDICQSAGLCDEGEGPPLHVQLLQYVYAPKIKDGVTARESSDFNAFPVLLQQLAEQAKNWVINSFNNLMLSGDMGQSLYDANRQRIGAEIKEAEEGYIQAVDTAWTGDITGRVMPGLLQKRANYASTQIASVALGAAEAYAQNAVPPSVWVRSRCVQDFADYRMVDLWISHFPDKANNLGLTSNSDWCGSLFGKHRGKFTDSFRQFVKSKVCPSSGEIVCNDVAGLRLCSGLLGTVDIKQECGWSITKVGKQAAQMIQDEFKARGSKIPCNIVPPQLPKSLVQLQCTRPTQFAWCPKVYDEKFSDLPRLLDCSLKETEEYKALRAQVVTAMNTLNGEFGSRALVLDPYDPLIVLAKDVSIDEVKGYPQQDWGFGPPSAQRGFEYLASIVPPYSIDGRSTPAVWNEAHMERMAKDKARPTVDMHTHSPGDLRVDLDNPVVHPLDAASRLRVPGLAGTTVPQQQHQQQVMSGSLPPLPELPGELQPGTQGVQQLQPTPPTPTIRPSGKSACPFCPSGELQSTTSAPTIRPHLPISTATAERPGVTVPGSRDLAMARPLPDLTYSGMPRVGGAPVAWNGSVTVDALHATRSGDLCHFPLDYAVRNGGEQDSGPFRATVANTVVPGSGWQHALRALSPGASMTDSGTIALRAGVNSLQFVLDDSAMVAEANETNNRATLTVIVNGSCGSSSSSREPMSDPRRFSRPGQIGH